MARILEGISSPADLKRLDAEQLKILAGEIREVIVSTVRQTGGHLGANLGAVEIILAIHSVINSPTDKVVFDVGHQAYTHKLITGRYSQFGTLRQFSGLSGFPRRCESPHDAFGVGHAGTSVSAALGYCLARDARGEDYKVVTVTGDGALTSGMVFEALNHAGELKTDLVVVLNDNEMSIAPNVGALANYLTRMRTEPAVSRAKEDLERLITRIPAIGGQVMKAAEKVRDTLRYLVVPGAIFQEMGFAYYGPIDGHDISMLQRVLREAIARGGPVLIHAITQKGRGYEPAESDPGRLHVLKPPVNGNAVQQGVSYSTVFGQSLLELARADSRIAVITAAMPDGTGTSLVAEELPKQFFDVGIAEEHAVTLAAGMACGGLRPVCAIYSSFLQRSYDQIMHDVCIQELPVTFCLDRAGLVGDDGPTHHGAFDLSYLRTMPHMVIMAPRNGTELRNMLSTALHYPGPAALRYPRGLTIPPDMSVPPNRLPIGKAEVVVEGDQVVFLAVGSMVDIALTAARLLAEQGVSAAVVNARFVKPIDEELIVARALATGALITVEENSVVGGFGSAVLECLARHDITGVRVKVLGLPDKFVPHGATEKLLELCGLTPQHLVAAALSLVHDGAEYKAKASVR